VALAQVWLGERKSKGLKPFSVWWMRPLAVLVVGVGVVVVQVEVCPTKQLFTKQLVDTTDSHRTAFLDEG